MIGDAVQSQPLLEQVLPGRITSYNVCYTKLLRRIGELLRSGFPVSADTPEGTRPITHDDVAILFRTTSRQHLFEKRLRLHGIRNNFV